MDEMRHFKNCMIELECLSSGKSSMLSQLHDGGNNSRRSDKSVRPQHKTERGHKKTAQPTSGTASDKGQSVTLANNQGM